MDISIALIILLGLCGDYLFRQLKLPGLVGMLLVGVLIGPYMLNLMVPEMMTVSGDFRKIALIVILLRAGFELRRDTLNRVGRPAIIMSAVPAIFEIIGVMIVAPFLLKITYIEAAILGAILGAVSPAVVVPLMIDFMDRGRGTKKGIPTLILGASSVDDVFVIVLFTIFLGMYGGGDVNLWTRLAEIPLSIVLGIIAGLISGYLLYLLFNKYDWRPPKRTIVVMGIAIFLTWLEEALKAWVPFASLLGVMTIGFRDPGKIRAHRPYHLTEIEKIMDVRGTPPVCTGGGASQYPGCLEGRACGHRRHYGGSLIQKRWYLYLTFSYRPDPERKTVLCGIIHPQGHSSGSHRRRSPGCRGGFRGSHPGRGGPLHFVYSPHWGHRHHDPGRAHPGQGGGIRLPVQ